MACLSPGQKVNHFPGTWALGRKDNLNKHLMVQYRRFGPENYGFFPKGYLLPRDRSRLKQDMGMAKRQALAEWKKYQQEQQEKSTTKNNSKTSNSCEEDQQQMKQEEFLKQLAAAGVDIPGVVENSVLLSSSQRQQYLFPPRKNPLYIFKRVAGACGRGMKVITKMPPGSWGTALVQEYIDRPLLVNGFKFDLRIYVVVTSFNPLRCYVYREGLARFATTKYPTGSNANAKDRTAHLTNFSVNRNMGNLNKKEQESVMGILKQKNNNNNKSKQQNSSSKNTTPRNTSKNINDEEEEGKKYGNVTVHGEQGELAKPFSGPQRMKEVLTKMWKNSLRK